jgi:energy-coupling factor transporter ATP-binding protein EcfA2
MSITEIRMKNLRGFTKSVDLGQRTLFSGPNGSGKSTHVAAIHLALAGYIPGHDKSEAFANASGNPMEAGVTIDGKKIDRVWAKKKALSETLTVDGIAAPKNGADALIQMAVGKEPRIFDVKAFFASTATEMRRICLGLVADEAAKLMQEEAKARENKNTLAEKRRNAEAAVARLLESKAALNAVAGSAAAVRERVKNLREELREIDGRIAKMGERQKEADRLKSLLEAPALDVEQAKATIAEIDETIADLATERAAVLVPGAYVEPDGIIALRDKVAQDKKALAEIVRSPTHSTIDLRTKAVVMASNTDIQTVIGKVIGVVDSSITDVLVGVTERLASLVSVNDDGLSLVEQIEEKTQAIDTIQAELVTAENESRSEYAKLTKATADTLRDIDDKAAALQKARAPIQKSIDDHAARQAAIAELQTSAGGVVESGEENDLQAREGIAAQLKSAEEQLPILERCETIEAEITKAKVESERISRDEDKAKETLEDVLKRQAAIVGSVREDMKQRSMNVLPDGYIWFEDDGARQFEVMWVRKVGPPVHRTTLSGGEQVIFDAAVGYVLAPKALIVLEAAEVDCWPNVNTLHRVLTRLHDIPNQVVVLTCHPVSGDCLAGWSIMNMEK